LGLTVGGRKGELVRGPRCERLIGHHGQADLGLAQKGIKFSFLISFQNEAKLDLIKKGSSRALKIYNKIWL
jgi:hypothetical protein